MTVRHILSTAILILFFFSLHAQRLEKGGGSVKGRVTTSDGTPAASVVIQVTDAAKTVLSDEEGVFIIHHLKPGSHKLKITLVGYRETMQEATVEEGKTISVSIQLDVSDRQLKEVIISSYHNKYKTASSVDAAKIPLTNLENPQVYSSVNKELIQEQGLYTADDALKNTPGLAKMWSATNRSGDGGANFTLRGFVVQPLLRNGLSARVNSTLDAANLERVEVIKGPSGTLYGSSLTSYGGLINRVTKKPYDRFGGEIGFSTGSYDLNRVSADINTPLDSARQALLRINTAYSNTGSFQDNGYNKNFVFDPSFVFKVTPRLTLSFDAEISHTNATTPVMYFFNTTVADLGVDRADKLNVNYKKSYQGNDLDITSENANFFALADYKISDHWKSQTNVSVVTSSSKGPEPYFYLLPGNDSISRNVWTVDGNNRSFQAQQNFVGDFAIGHLRNRIVAGLDFLNQYTNVRYIDPNGGSDLFDVINTVGAIPAYNDFTKSATDALYENEPKSISYNRNNTYIYGAYVSDVLNVTDNLLVMASVRAERFYTRPVDDPTSATSSSSFSQTTFSPKFGLIYQVIKEKLSFFGNYMNGFTNPGYNLSYDATSNSNVNRLFKAEQANQWEGGVKMDLFQGRLSGTLSYYDIQVKNKVRSDAQHANAYVQDGTQYSRGFEAEVTANPVSGFNLIVGYSHNNSKMEKSSTYDNGMRPQTSGPADMANLWASYTLTSGAAKGLGIGFGGNYAGDNKVLNNTYNGTFILPSYTILNTGLFYNQPRFRVAVNVNNLTDKKYWIGYSTANPQMLRQVIGSITYKF